MVGAIIGDIVGSRFEFNNHRSTEFEFFHPDCKFTDDTVMTVAVADAILSKRPFGEVMHEYGRKYPNRGYGGRFFKWLLSKNPKPYDSFGNGSAMRVSPCAFLASGNREKALTWATASAVCTHNHPEGIKGAMAITATSPSMRYVPATNLTKRVREAFRRPLSASWKAMTSRAPFVSPYPSEETATPSPISPAVSPRHITEFRRRCGRARFICSPKRCKV